MKELGDLHDRKQADYGRPGDPFANVRASEAFGVPGWVGCLMRANDKIIRIQKAAKGGKLANESLEDSLRDLAVYSIIGLCLFEEFTTPKTLLEPVVLDGIVVDSSLDREVDEAFERLTRS